MRTIRRHALVLGAAGALFVGAGAGAVPAAADSVHVVHPGESIQKAIDDADPGDTVEVRAGTYRESLTIRKALTLEGAGSDEGGTVLKPPSKATGFCNEPKIVNGICVIGKVDKDFNLLRRVHDVTVKDLRVTGFSGTGVLSFGTRELTVKRVKADDNDEYGIAGFDGKESVFADNVALDNVEPGLYMGDSKDADNEMYGNVVRRNEIGLFLRDSTDFDVHDNVVTGNCAGIVALDTYADAGNFSIKDNLVRRNNKACAAHEDEPALSGIGIALAGVDDTTVEHNAVLRNRPSGPTLMSGGVVVFSTKQFGGTVPQDNTVKRNVVLHNKEADLVWDKTGSGNTFTRNVCQTSKPSGLCHDDD